MIGEEHNNFTVSINAFFIIEYPAAKNSYGTRLYTASQATSIALQQGKACKT